MELENLLSESINQLAQDLAAQKDDLIAAKMIDLGIDPNEVLKEPDRRFKKLVREFKDGCETYWYNDGTDEVGIRIITFKNQKFGPFTEEMEKGKLSVTLQYY